MPNLVERWVATLEKVKTPPGKSHSSTEAEDKENSKTLCREMRTGKLNQMVFTTMMHVVPFKGFILVVDHRQKPGSGQLKGDWGREPNPMRI